MAVRACPSPLRPAGALEVGARACVAARGRLALLRRSNHFALLNFVSCRDMHAFALVKKKYTYACVYVLFVVALSMDDQEKLL